MISNSDKLLNLKKSKNTVLNVQQEKFNVQDQCLQTLEKKSTSFNLFYPLDKTCQMGDHCNFAHGIEELRKLSDVIYH
jgi:hypothetical protein